MFVYILKVGSKETQVFYFLVSCVSLLLRVHMLVCVCVLLLHLVGAVTRKVLGALLSLLKCVCCFCIRLWHQTGRKKKKLHTNTH